MIPSPNPTFDSGKRLPQNEKKKKPKGLSWTESATNRSRDLISLVILTQQPFCLYAHHTMTCFYQLVDVMRGRAL